MSAGTIAWLESARNLWNVAISRARAHLIVVGDKPFWERRDGVGADLAAATPSLMSLRRAVTRCCNSCTSD